MNHLRTFSSDYKLQRWPVSSTELLQAWDAADEYLINHLAGNLYVPTRTLIINDQFGALTVSFNKLAPINWSDSFISHSAARNNLHINNLPALINAIPSTSIPDGKFKLVIIKIPKSNALLEYQLNHVRNLIDDDTKIIGAGMSRHIHSSTLLLFEKLIGKTTTSKAIKKARLIFPEHSLKHSLVNQPELLSYYQQDLQLKLSNHANVFSREKLDIGSRFLIDQYDKLPAAKDIIDLACGNGVLGIMAKKAIGNCRVNFVDESYMAIDSARINYDNEFKDNSAVFHVDDCLTHYHDKKVDLIVCNPPFHQQHSISDKTAFRMFLHSKKNLGNGGQLWVVGNRHMNYHTKLKKLFGNCHTIASNKKFTVLRSESII